MLLRALKRRARARRRRLVTRRGAGGGERAHRPELIGVRAVMPLDELLQEEAEGARLHALVRGGVRVLAPIVEGGALGFGLGLGLGLGLGRGLWLTRGHTG